MMIAGGFMITPDMFEETVTREPLKGDLNATQALEGSIGNPTTITPTVKKITSLKGSIKK